MCFLGCTVPGYPGGLLAVLVGVPFLFIFNFLLLLFFWYFFVCLFVSFANLLSGDIIVHYLVNGDLNKSYCCLLLHYYHW